MFFRFQFKPTGQFFLAYLTGGQGIDGVNHLDLYDLIDPDHQQSDAGQIVERAKALEANFASGYPGAERFLREVIDALVRMGI